MAESTTGYLVMPDGARYDFTLNGLAQFNQLERLIKLTAELIKLKDPNNETAKNAAKNLKDLAKSAKNTESEIRDLEDSVKNTRDTFRDAVEELEQTFRPIFRGDWRTSLDKMPGLTGKLAVGVGLLTGSLVGYADQLSSGLQRGISGGIFDFAIAAKSAGISISAFGKALEESGGGFASLDTGATAGAKQFGLLIDSVRNATADVGNLGLNNEQMAEFTARQLKVAISQGFKGKQAQDQVIKNSRELAEELDILANKTGKSVLELAQAAAKLAMDPIVANFIKNAKYGGDRISSASERFAANLRAMFGELGETLAADALRSSMSGLPLVITQTGKNMILASQGFYSELERLAASVRDGTYSDEDQEKLYQIIQKEVQARGQELRYLAQLEGPVGQSAKQFLELAKEAEFYNSAAGRERRERDKTAQQFNAEVRKFQSNLQKLAIPFLQLINEINWADFFAVFNAGFKIILDAVKLTSEFISRFKEKINSVINLIPGLGDIEDPLGKSVGYLIGLGSAIVVAIGAFSLLKASFTGISKIINSTIINFSTLKDSVNRLADYIRQKITGASARGTVISNRPDPWDQYNSPTYKRRENEAFKDKIEERKKQEKTVLTTETPKTETTLKRLFSTSIDAGYGTSPSRPLYVNIVRGLRTLRGREDRTGPRTDRNIPPATPSPGTQPDSRQRPAPPATPTPQTRQRPTVTTAPAPATSTQTPRTPPPSIPVPTPATSTPQTRQSPTGTTVNMPDQDRSSRFGSVKGAVATGALIVGGSVAADMIMNRASDQETDIKETSSMTGGLLGSIAGAGGAALLGRFIGGGIGTALGGPFGTIIGSTLGGVLGQYVGEAIPDFLSKDDDDSISSLKQKQEEMELKNASLYNQNLELQKQILAKLTESENTNRFAAGAAVRQASNTESSLRYLRDQHMYTQSG